LRNTTIKWKKLCQWKRDEDAQKKQDSEKKTVVSENSGEKRGPGRPKKSSEKRGRPRKSSAEKAATKKAPKRKSTPKTPTSPKRKSARQSIQKEFEDDEPKYQEEEESEGEFEVEKLLDVKKQRGKNGTQYLVRWAGFSSAHDTWEPARNLPKRKITAFNKKQEHADPSDSDENYTSEEENEEFEVEKIIDEKLYYGKPRYLVSWKGYKKDHNTWQDVDSLKSCKEVLKNWELKKQEKAEKKEERNEKNATKKAEREEAKLTKAAENAAKKATTA